MREELPLAGPRRNAAPTSTTDCAQRQLQALPFPAAMSRPLRLTIVDEVMQRHRAAIEQGKTTHKGGELAEKTTGRDRRRYQHPDEGYLSD